MDDIKVWGDVATGLQEKTALSMGVFPNPVEDVISLSNINTLSTIQFYDAMGKQVLSVTNPKEATLDVSNLKAGVYFISTSDQNGKHASAKILKK